MNQPDGSLGALARIAAGQGLKITPQGLDQRFTESATVFVQQALEQAITALIAADKPVNWPLARRFSAVYVHDSSQIMLPNALSSVWQGTGGGATADAGNASLKVDLMYDLNSGQARIALLQGRHADNRSPLLDDTVEPGCLHLKDLGYFNLERMRQQASRGEYWLSRLLTNTRVFATEDDAQAIDLETLLMQLKAEGQRTAELQVCVGKQARLPARLIMVRLSEASASRQRAALKATASKHGRTPSEKNLALCDWWLLITNVPEVLLSKEEAPNLYGARWQIELMFKLWKSQSRVAVSRSENKWRVLCEVYVKLLVALIQHWILLTGLWGISQRSLTKGVQGIQEQAGHLAACVSNRSQLIRCLKALSQIFSSPGCLQNKRKKRPSNWQKMGEVDGIEA